MASTEAAEIVFPEGIIGVPRAKRFLLLEQPDSPVRYLSSLDIKGFSLPVVDPFLAEPDYAPRLGARVGEALQAGDSDAVLMLAIANVEDGGTVANLRAPLLINVSRQRGVQVILDDARHSLRAPVQKEAVAVGS